MIITKTPYRISFFGGGTDYPTWYKENGGAFLSTTINKFIFLTLKKINFSEENTYRVIWSKIERTNNLKKINHKVVREMIQHFKYRKGMDIYYCGDLPAKSGMGSSSSFVVGLYNLFTKLKNKNITKKELAKNSIFFEQKILKENVGIQDQISAAYGGFNKVNISKNGNFNVEKINLNNDLRVLNKNLILIYTGINRTASDIASKYIFDLNKKKIEMKEIFSHVDEATNLIKKKKFDEFGKLLHEGWKVKKSLSKIITNNKIDELYEFSLKNGALGGKVLGAGGGGFLLLYVKKNTINNFLKNKKIKIIPFNFSQAGSEVVLNTENDNV